MLIGKLGSHSAMTLIVLINAKITTRLTTRKDEYFINFKSTIMKKLLSKIWNAISKFLFGDNKNVCDKSTKFY